MSLSKTECFQSTCSKRSEPQLIGDHGRIVRLAIGLKPGEAKLPQGPVIAGSSHLRAKAQGIHHRGQVADPRLRVETQGTRLVRLS